MSIQTHKKTLPCRHLINEAFQQHLRIDEHYNSNNSVDCGLLPSTDMLPFGMGIAGTA